MSDERWFRKFTWTKEDQEDFFTHLEESDNPYHKAQYIRIQALHLQDVGNPYTISGAIKLLELLIEKWPEPSQMAMAHLQRAECFIALGYNEEAAQAFRASLEAKRVHPDSIADTPLSFGMFAIIRELTDLYDEVVDVLDEFLDASMRPADEYQYYAIKSVIAAHGNDADKARDYAREAINAAQKVYSGTHYDKLGLKIKPESITETIIHKKVCDLAGL